MPQNKQITTPAKAKKGSKMDLKNGTQKSSLKSTRNRPKIDFKVKIGPALKRVYSKLKLSAIFANFFKIE